MAIRKPIRRAITVVVAFVFAIALIEGTLQIYGAAARWRSDAEFRNAGADGRPVVVFCGDSNMYGLYLENPEGAAMPKQVEALSNGEIHSINLGMPAAPSWVVLDQVKRGLTLKPAAVVARTGINNTWQIPPGEGAGIFENLIIVRMLRLKLFNRSVESKRNTLGPGGRPLDDVEFKIDDKRSEMRLAARDGGVAPFEIRRPPDEKVKFDRASQKMRDDIDAMAAACEKAGAKFILASYLEGYHLDFESIRSLVMEYEHRPGVLVADCSPYLRMAVNGASAAEATMPPPPRELELARRSYLITRDCHPTALGYAIEARVVAAKLAEAGILKHYKSEDPLAPFAKAEIEIPKLRQLATRFAFEVIAKPGDKVSLVAGIPGESIYKEVNIPIDYKSLQLRPPAIMPPVAPVADAGPGGRAELVIPEKTLNLLKPGIKMLALIERGGQFGAARILITNTIDWRPGR